MEKLSIQQHLENWQAAVNAACAARDKAFHAKQDLLRAVLEEGGTMANYALDVNVRRLHQILRSR